MNNKEAAKLVASAMGAAILAGVIGSNNTNQKVEAATNNQQVRGVLRVKYNGLGGVNLLDNNGHFQDKYVYNNSAFKVWEKATINDQTMYRIGTQKQWIPAQYTNWDDGSSRKQNVNAVTIKYVPGYGINLWKTPASKEWTGRRLPHNSSWKVFGTAVGDDGYVWYNLGGDQWIPSRYTNKPIKAAASDSNVVTIKYVPGYGINLWKTPASKEWTGRRLAHNSSWRVYKTAVGDDGYIWYNLGGDQWIPSRYTNRPVKASSSATSSQSSKASSSSASSAASSQSSKASSSSVSSAASSQSSKASSSSASSAASSQSSKASSSSVSSAASSQSSKASSSSASSAVSSQSSKASSSSASSAASSQSSRASSSSASSAASSQSSKASSSSASSAVSSQSSKASSSSASSASASQSGSSSENSGFTSNNGIWTDSERQEAEQYFLQLVNEWNAKQGNTVPFVINSEKQSLAEFRAQQNIESIEKTGDIDDHMPNGVPFLNQPEFKNSKVPVVTEVQGMQGSASGMTPKEFVDAAFDAFIYRDGPSWQHRESLRSGTKEELEVDSLPFGVGIKQVRHNGMIINVIDALI
ncbi:hypothetical protein QP094_01180 [Lactobacillus jensenii]|uniref:hypothetical protein n=1 Tax=Lactobacillus jensenii TaxID=109790 RepID=UPI001FB98976|nr:hypothetical protein [Lactobacillus jensenii]MCW8080800.1 hypothetical protein [Lactobacillus jensenii]MCW8088934.1 hypothetical protein [Lactobacillus jensenii]MCZ9641144.1 hypothetical protein [Lactobacillus jensenii]MCZ9657044.1 hypothetical protein [Lactobacillus jensenii]MCZ9660110.1 hypothetical protein [Lactobacillus jensenii]